MKHALRCRVLALLFMATSGSIPTARAQLAWSAYSDRSQTVSAANATADVPAGTYAAGQVMRIGTETGGDTGTATFSIPAGAYVDLVAQNFTATTVSLVAPTRLKIPFTIKATPGSGSVLAASGYVLAVGEVNDGYGAMNTPPATLANNGYYAALNNGASSPNYLEWYSTAGASSVPSAGYIGSNASYKYDTSTDNVGTANAGTSGVTDGTSYTGFFDLIQGGTSTATNIEMGSSATLGSTTNGLTLISAANSAQELSGDAKGTSGNGASVAPQTSFTVDAFLIGVGNASAAPASFSISGLSFAVTGTGAANPTVSAPPAITAQPTASTLLSPGASLSLTVAASGATSYQWYLGNSALSDGTQGDSSVITGSATGSLTVANATTAESGSYYAVAKGTGASIASANAVVLVTNASIPVITSAPSALTVNAGSAAAFSVVASGTPAPTYQWAFGGTSIAGATSATYSIASVGTADAGSYAVTVANAAGSITSAGATLTVDFGPAISAQPAGQVVVAGASATFTVAASGNPAPAYQWAFGGTVLVDGTQADGSTVSGSQTAALTVAQVTVAEAGSYSVTASNSVGSAGASAALTVEYGPAFTSQPSSQTVNAGGPVTFSATASGNPAPTYQWLFDGSSIGGATSSSYSIATVGAGDAGTYAVVVSNAVTSTVSPGAALTVDTAPVITTQPVSAGANVGDAVSFTAAASGNPAPAYQWAFDGSAIAGATSSTYAIASAALTDSGSYAVTASNSAGSATSNGATLTVGIVLTIGTQPASETVNVGDTASFSIGAAGNPAPTYQWSFDGTPIAGATSSAYSIAQVALTDAGTYSVTVVSGSNTATGTPAVLTVDSLPVFTAAPASQELASGATVTFTAAATGNPAPTYQWSLNGTDVTDGTQPDGSVISGSATGTLTIVGIDQASVGAYVATASNAAGSLDSDQAVLTVDFMPSVDIPPASQTVGAGGAVTFSVTAEASPAPSFQWSFDGTAIGGATSSTFSVASASTADAGNYAVTISNGLGSVTTDPAVLTVSSVPVIISQPQSQSVTVGSSVTFTVVATEDLPPDFQWTFDGLAILGATSPIYTLPDVTAADAGAYAVTLSNTAGSVSSPSVQLTITGGTAPAITTQPTAQAVTEGSTLTLTVVATGTPAPGYQWYFNGVPTADGTISGETISGSTSSTLTIGNIEHAISQGTYLVSVVNGVSGVNSNPVQVLVGDAPSVYQEPPASVTTVVGGTAVFTAAAGGSPGPTVQWNFNGTAIGGATSSTYVLSNVQSGNAGSYTMTASNGFGSPATSTGSVLTVDTDVAITTQPIGGNVAVGTSLTLTVVATGTPAPSYQWYFNGVAISGASSSTLSIANAQHATNQGTYLVSVVNGVSGVNSNGVEVLVGNAPTISQQPAASVTTVVGATAVFTAAAGGSPGPTVQWNFNGTAIGGATSSTYVLSNVQAGNAGSYTMTASNGFGSAVTSSGSTLTVDTGVAITTQPTGGNVAVGTTLTLTVVATGTPAPSYQWYFNGVAIGGASSATLSIANAQHATNQGTYLVSVVNGVSGVNSSGVQVLVGNAPTINQQPAASVTTVVGGTAVFTAGASGSPTPAVQWNFNGTAIGGATSSTYVLSNVQSGNAGSYTMTASNGFGSAVTSSGSTLTAASAPAITMQPQAQLGDSGETVTLTVVASGSPAPTYQWAENGTAIAGASSSSYAIVYATQANSGYYTVALSNGIGGKVTSSQAYVHVAAPVLSWTQASVTASEGITTTFVVPAGVSRSILVAGLGPVIGGVATPTVTLYNASHAVILTATGMSTFSGAYQATVVSAANGHAGIPITTSSADSAFLETLAPGSYQAVVTGGGNSGIAQLAVYDLSNQAFADTQTTTQGPVSGNSAPMVERFLVAGASPDTVLVTALGPGLSVGSPLADPELVVFNEATMQGGGTDTGNAGSTVATDESNDLGYTMNAADSGLVLTLNPGVYIGFSLSASGTNSGTSEIDVLQQ